MSLIDQNAFPCEERIYVGGGVSDRIVMNQGLTKRKYFAAKALQGVIAGKYATPEEYAKYAVECADALLTALSNKIT